MKLLIPLAIAALLWLVDARFLALTTDIRGADLTGPAQTQAPALPDIDIANILSAPASRTTEAPSRAVVELRLRQDSPTLSSSSNTWVNAQTCGWYSGLSSKPYVCGSSLACATNTDNVVACSTAGLDQFYTICLNYEAVQSSKCTSAGPKTGCCNNAASPACGTYQWAGTPTRSMFGCFATPTLIAMIDEPQFVLDASISSASVASSSSASAAASRSSASMASASSASQASGSAASESAAETSAAASRASELGGSSVTITTTTADGSPTTFTAVAGATGSASGVTFITSVLYTTTGSNGASTTYTAIEQQLAGANGSSGTNGTNGSNGGSGTSTGAIAGAVVGGILGLLLLLFLMWYLLNKKKGIKLRFKFCGGKKKVYKEDNRKYNDKREYTDRREYDNRQSSGSGTAKGRSSLFGGGAKAKSKKEEQTTNNHYYGDQVRNDNRLYDKRKYKDNRKYNSDSDSHSGTPTQNFRFETGPQGSNGRRPSLDSRDETIVGIGSVSGRGSSRREQRKQGRLSQTRNHIPDSRSPSPAPVSPMSELAVGGSTSRRDKRRRERQQARGEFASSPERQAEQEMEYSEQEDVHRASGRSGQWQLPSQLAIAAQEGASRQPQNVHLHVHIHDGERDRESRRGRSRQSQERSRASSHRAPHDNEDELDEEEERQQQLERGRQGSRTHRYHPGSGRRHAPGTPSPSPPPPLAAPPDDFLGKAL